MAQPKTFRTRKQKREPIPFEIVVDIDPDVDQPVELIDDPEWTQPEDDPNAKIPQIPNPLFGRVEERQEDPNDPESEMVKVRVHEFQSRGSVPGALLLDLVASGISTEGGFQAAAMQRFLSQCISKNDRARFLSLLQESDPPIDMGNLQEVVQFLAEQLGNARPTK